MNKEVIEQISHSFVIMNSLYKLLGTVDLQGFICVNSRMAFQSLSGLLLLSMNNLL